MKHNDGGYSPDCPYCQTLPHPARHDDTVWALPAKEPVWKGSVGQIRSASEVMATASEHGRRQAEAQERIADTLGRIQGILRDMLIEISGQGKV